MRFKLFWPAPILALLLPLPFLSRSLWLDEASSVWFARLPLGDLLFRLCDPHPPGYYLLLKGWLALGDGEAWLRLPSLLASALAVALLARAGQKLAGTRTGLLAALLLATSPLQAWYAAEVRMYAVAQALGVAMSLPALRLWETSEGEKEAGLGRAGPAALFWALALLALAVDVSALLPYFAIQLLWLARGRPDPRRWLPLQAAVLLPAALWWLAERRGTETYHAVFVAVQARRLGLPLTPGSAEVLLLGLAVAAGLTAAVLAWGWQGRLRWIGDRPAVTWLLLAAWAVLLIFSAVPRLFSVKRLLVVLLPYLALLVAHRLARWRPGATPPLWATWLAVAPGLAVTLWMLVSFQREPWREMVAGLYAAGDARPAVVWVDEMAVPAFDFYARRAPADQVGISWTSLLGRDLPDLPDLAPSAGGTLWLVLAENPYRDLRAFLPTDFYRQYRLEAAAHAPGIGLWRYRRLSEPLPAPSAIPEPSEEAQWGLRLPSPLATCR